MRERTDAEIEAAAKAIYPILQDILNGRVLRIPSADVPEFALARAAVAAADAVAPATARIEALKAAGKGLADAVSRILPPYVAAGANEPRAWRELRVAIAAWREAEKGG